MQSSECVAMAWNERLGLVLADAGLRQTTYGMFFFFFQAEDGIRDLIVTGVQTCALPIWAASWSASTDGLPALRSQALGRRAGEAAPRGVEARALVPEDAGGRPLRAALRVQIGRASCRERV